MAYSQIIFVCQNCGEEYSKWQGKCLNCGEWNTIKEFKTPQTSTKTDNTPAEVFLLNDIKTHNYQRISTKIKEFDRVLGGGIMPGSIMILGGDPGIGKSTLLLQLASKVEDVLYISGEESVEQIKLRFDRLKSTASKVKIVAETDLGKIVATILKEKPKIVIVDSIQTIYSSNFPSTPGSIVQVRECALRLQQLSKTTQTAVILVGHVTKEGTVAGPRTLEHLVDIVLYLEGERFHQNRILRTVKNRYGATDEIGIFEMGQNGLIEILNPSKLFLAERLQDVAGTVVTASVEGSRSLLVEIQALTSTATFGYPQRRVSGFDLNRLQLIVAVLQKKISLNLSSQDVFINIVGGVKIKEPAIDLAVAMAIISSYKNKPLDSNLCVFGELGLSGEIRQVSFLAKRQSEAKRLGFNKFILSKTIQEVLRSYFV